MTYRFSGFREFSDCESDHDEHENDCWTYSVNLGYHAVFNGESTKTTKGDTLLTIERNGEGVVYSLNLPMGTTVSYDSRAAHLSEKLNMHVEIICISDTLRVVITGSPNASYDRDEMIPDYSGGLLPTLSETMEQSKPIHQGSRHHRHRRRHGWSGTF